MTGCNAETTLTQIESNGGESEPLEGGNPMDTARDRSKNILREMCKYSPDQDLRATDHEWKR